MVMDQTTTARRPAHPEVRLSRNEVIAAGPVKCAELAAPAAAVDRAVALVAPEPKQPLFEAIEEQHSSLLNVLCIVRCIGMGVADGEKKPAPEIATAFELLECEIQRIATALKKISLRSAMREICATARPGIPEKAGARSASVRQL
jgi:hypothetical protein